MLRSAGYAEKILTGMDRKLAPTQLKEVAVQVHEAKHAPREGAGDVDAEVLREDVRDAETRGDNVRVPDTEAETDITVQSDANTNKKNRNIYSESRTGPAEPPPLYPSSGGENKLSI